MLSDFFNRDLARNSVGVGWRHLIDAVFNKIELGKTPWDDVVVLQVKEKFGTLRIYYSGGDDYVRGFIDALESASAHSCEECGSSSGQTTAHMGRWLTLCSRCMVQREKRECRELKRAVRRAWWRKQWNKFVQFIDELTSF